MTWNATIVDTLHGRQALFDPPQDRDWRVHQKRSEGGISYHWSKDRGRWCYWLVETEGCGLIQSVTREKAQHSRLLGCSGTRVKVHLTHRSKRVRERVSERERERERQRERDRERETERERQRESLQQQEVEWFG